MDDTPHNAPKSYAELITSYSASQYKVWLDMAAKEANETENNLPPHASDFSIEDEGYPVKEYSALEQKFI